MKILILFLMFGHFSFAEQCDETPPNQAAITTAFACQVKGEETGKETYRLEISNCRGTSQNGVLAQAVNGRVFSEFKIALKGTKEAIQVQFGKIVVNYIENNGLNPGRTTQNVSKTDLQIARADKSFEGTLKAELSGFQGEISANTDLDKFALGYFYNIQHFMQVKDLILMDLRTMAQKQPASVVKTSSAAFQTDDWQIESGNYTRDLFDLIKQSYQQQQTNAPMVYKTTAGQTQMTESKFPCQWSHTITAFQTDVGLEYYLVLRSFLIVAKISADRNVATDDGWSQYILIWRYPEWRNSFATSQGGANFGTSSLLINKEYSEDIIKIIKAAPRKVGQTEFAIGLNFSEYSHRLMMTSPHVYPKKRK